jgi:hypothetical protein
MVAFFDTHASIKKLTDAGFTEQQAEAQVQVIADILQSNLATKLDIAEVKRDIEALRLATKADLESLRLATKADLAELKSDLIKWMAGLIIGSMGFMTTLFVVIVKFL